MQKAMRATRKTIRRQAHTLYEWMLASYGPQGWWPLLDCTGTNPTKTGALKGYHPGDYTYPRNENQLFEICVGAILTQNTAWVNVEKALTRLKDAHALDAKRLLSIEEKKLKKLISSARYFNQKTEYLRGFAQFYLSLKGKTPARSQLLNVRGIGNETADSILLYAYGQPEFVVDAYTGRICSHLGLWRQDCKYMLMKNLFETAIPKQVEIYQEYHALLVEHAKRFYTKKPYGETDPLVNLE